MLKAIFITVLALVLLGSECRFTQRLRHNSPVPPADLNKLTNDIIRNKMYLCSYPSVQNRQMFTNQSFANALINDLYQVDDSKRVLKSIDRQSGYDLLALFGIRGTAICGLNTKPALTGADLACLNQIFSTVKANPSKIA